MEGGSATSEIAALCHQTPRPHLLPEGLGLGAWTVRGSGGMGGDDAQIAQRESISEPGPVKGDQPWAGVGEDGNEEGGRGEGREARGAATAEMNGREGGWRGAAVQAESCAGAWAGKGGSGMTHARHTRTADTGACGHTQGTRALRLWKPGSELYVRSSDTLSEPVLNLFLISS